MPMIAALGFRGAPAAAMAAARGNKVPLPVPGPLPKLLPVDGLLLDEPPDDRLLVSSFPRDWTLLP